MANAEGSAELKSGIDILARATSRFTAFARLTETDHGHLAEMMTATRTLRRGEFLCHEGDEPTGCYLVLDGWTASSLAFANGTRQIVKIHMPGDMIGLPSMALTRAVASVVALTATTVGIIPRVAIGHLFEVNPRLGALLFLISQEERISLIDRLASIGASNTISRLAALIIHVHARALCSDPTTVNRFNFPLLQADVADLIGVTTVHLNRTIQHLRAEKLITYSQRIVTILDWEGLLKLGGLPARELDYDAAWLPRPTDPAVGQLPPDTMTEERTDRQ